jgi:ABC-type lipoprotein release transport system permease subunit
MVLRRVRANARLLAAVVIGAVIAAALLSTTQIYPDALRELGLSYTLQQVPEDEKNLRVQSTSQASRADLYETRRDLIEDAATRHLGGLLAGQTWIGRSATFFPTPPGGAVTDDPARLRANVQFISGLEPHIEVISGELPVAAVAPADGSPPSIEVALGAETAAKLDIKVGDRFDIHPFLPRDAAPIDVTIAAIIAPLDPEDPYFVGMGDLFYTSTPNWDTLILIVPEETFFDAVVAYLPTITSDFWNLTYVDTTQINGANAEESRLRVEAFRGEVTRNIERTVVETRLTEILETFDEKLFFTRLPFLVLLLQVAGIVLYYLFMVSTMLVERQESEIALLKSRGATTGQVMRIYFIEGLLIAGVAIAAGPPLAGLVVGLLGRTPAFTDLTGGANLLVSISGTAYLWAAAGAGLAFLALTWPAYNATRRTVVQYKTAAARPPQQAAFTKYYLDLVLVGVGAILFYQLDRRGSLVTDRFFGEQTIDPVQLLTPSLFIVAVAIFFLRLFPILLRGLAWLVAHLKGTAVLIGMWQLVRNPTHYSRLVLLLILATAVGMFAASFGATLNQSYEDRAAYTAGAPYRIADITFIDTTGPDTFEAAVTEMSGAEAVSPALRIPARSNLDTTRDTLDLLAIDPASFAEVGYFRGDFAGDSLSEISEALVAEEPAARGIPIPEGTRWLGMWVKAAELRGRILIDANLVDADGRYVTVRFRAIGDTRPDAEMPADWTFVVADMEREHTDVSRFREAPPVAPIALQSLSVRMVSSFSFRSGAVQFDDLQASSEASLPPELRGGFLVDAGRGFPGLPNATTIDNFDSTATWRPLEGQFVNAPVDGLTTVPAPDGGAAAELRWDTTTGRSRVHGIMLERPVAPITVYASDAFLQQTGTTVGDQTSLYVNGTYVEATVVGRFRLFPTLGDGEVTSAVVTDLERLLTLINGNPAAQPVYANEAWLTPGPETAGNVEAAISAGRLFGQVFDLEELRVEQEKDPLLSAGWEGILFISFLAILLLSALGFLIYSYLTAQRRTLEFAILRTLGFSRSQIAAVVGFEQVFVIGLGMLAGSLVGLRLGTLMIDYMGLSETGDAVVPPMLLHVSWITLGTTWGALSVAFLVTIGIVVLLYSRLALHRVLRIGET